MHTPGPWETSVNSNGDFDVCGGHGGDIIADLSGCDNQQANSLRIIACVNACEGISTEALFKGTIQDLVEACRNIDQAWAGNGDMATAVDSLLLALAEAENENRPAR